MKYSIFKNEKGMSALLVVVIVGGAALLMALGAARLGLGEMEMGYISQKGGEALYLADGCAEEAMERLRVDASYTGGVLNLDAGSCIISVAVNGAERVITVSALIGEFNKKIQIDAALNGEVITIDAWKEIEL